MTRRMAANAVSRRPCSQTNQLVVINHYYANRQGDNDVIYKFIALRRHVVGKHCAVKRKK